MNFNKISNHDQEIIGLMKNHTNMMTNIKLQYF